MKNSERKTIDPVGDAERLEAAGWRGVRVRTEPGKWDSTQWTITGALVLPGAGRTSIPSGFDDVSIVDGIMYVSVTGYEVDTLVDLMVEGATAMANGGAPC